MSTILGDFLIRVNGDPSGLTDTFAKSAAASQQFVAQITAQAAKLRSVSLAATPNTDGLDAARAAYGRAAQAAEQFAQVAGRWRDGTSGQFVAKDLATQAIDGRRFALEQLQHAQTVYDTQVETSARQQNEFIRIQTRELAAEAETQVSIAQELVAKLSSIYAEARGVAAQQLSSRVIDQSQFVAAGARAKQAFNEGLASARSNLGALGASTAELDQFLSTQMKVIGVKEGELLDEAIAQGAAGGAARTAARINSALGIATANAMTTTTGAASRMKFAVTDAEGAFTSFGRRGSGAAFGVGLAIEQLANGSETGMRRASRAVSTFALGFGVQGVIVSAVIIAGLAIMDFFHKAERAAEEAAKKIGQTMASLAQNNDQLGLERQLYDLQRGAAVTVDDKGARQLHTESQVAPGNFEGGLTDLRAQESALKLRILTNARKGQLVGALQDQLRDLQSRMAPLTAVEADIEHLIMNPLPLHDFKPNAAVKITAKGPLSDARDRAKALTDQTELLVTQLGTLKAAGGRLDAASTEGQALLARAFRFLDNATGTSGVNTQRHGESLDVFTKRVKDYERVMTTVTDAVKTVKLPELKLPELNLDAPIETAFKASAERAQHAMEKSFQADSILAPLRRVADQAQIIQTSIEIQNKQRASTGQPLIDVDKALADYRKNASGIGVSLINEIRGSNIPLTDQVRLLDEVNSLLDRIGSKKIAKPFQELTKALNDVADTMQSLANLATATGGPNAQSTAKILQTGAKAATSIGDAAAQGFANPAADIQALADTISFGSALQGQANAIRIENNRVLNLNSAHLVDLGDKIAGFEVNAGTTQTAKSALQAFFADQNAVHAFASGATHSGGFLGSGRVGDLQTQINAVQPFLTQFGITFEQLKKIAADNGFEIFDKDGRIVTEALRQMATGITEATKAAFSFSSSVGDQTTLQNLRDKLSNKSSPLDQAQSQLDVLNRVAPQLLGGQSFDLASPQGQSRLRLALQSIVEQLANHTLDTTKLGAFANLGELTGVIDSLAGSLNTMTDAVNGVNAALTNVPTGFKFALATFDATSADMVSLTQADVARALPPNVSDSRPMTSSQPVIVVNVEAGAFQANGVNDPDALASGMVGTLQRRAMALGMDRSQWSEVQA